MVTESAVNIAKEYLSSLPPEMDVKRAYLFGSYAKGTQREESDIDIIVILNKTGFPKDYNEKMENHRAVIGRGMYKNYLVSFKYIRII